MALVQGQVQGGVVGDAGEGGGGEAGCDGLDGVPHRLQRGLGPALVGLTGVVQRDPVRLPGPAGQRLQRAGHARVLIACKENRSGTRGRGGLGAGRLLGVSGLRQDQTVVVRISQREQGQGPAGVAGVLGPGRLAGPAEESLVVPGVHAAAVRAGEDDGAGEEVVQQADQVRIRVRRLTAAVRGCQAKALRSSSPVRMAISSASSSNAK